MHLGVVAGTAGDRECGASVFARVGAWERDPNALNGDRQSIMAFTHAALLAALSATDRCGRCAVALSE